MKKLLLLSCIWILTGCSTVTIETSGDGSCKATRTSLLTSASSIQGEACGGSVGATDTNSNKQLTELLVALMRGMK